MLDVAVTLTDIGSHNDGPHWAQKIGRSAKPQQKHNIQSRYSTQLRVFWSTHWVSYPLKAVANSLTSFFSNKRGPNAMCALAKTWLDLRENSRVQKDEETKILLWGEKNFLIFEKTVGVTASQSAWKLDIGSRQSWDRAKSDDRQEILQKSIQNLSRSIYCRVIIVYININIAMFFALKWH